MKNLFIEYESKYNLDETIEILEEAITNGGWKISIVHDLQETLRKSSISVLPLKVMELCNPKYSSQILGPDDLRIYSSLLPCRISNLRKNRRENVYFNHGCQTNGRTNRRHGSKSNDRSL
ncbi:MAG: DUF302 domain-containing protein [Paludibacter sp.]